MGIHEPPHCGGSLNPNRKPPGRSGGLHYVDVFVSFPERVKILAVLE